MEQRWMMLSFTLAGLAAVGLVMGFVMSIPVVNEIPIQTPQTVLGMQDVPEPSFPVIEESPQIHKAEEPQAIEQSQSPQPSEPVVAVADEVLPPTSEQPSTNGPEEPPSASGGSEESIAPPGRAEPQKSPMETCRAAITVYGEVSDGYTKALESAIGGWGDTFFIDCGVYPWVCEREQIHAIPMLIAPDGQSYQGTMDYERFKVVTGCE